MTSYFHNSPRSLESDSVENAKILRKRLDGFLRREKELVAQQESQPYDWEWRRDLPWVRRDIAKLQRELARQEGNAGLTQGTRNDTLPAYGANASVWRRDLG
jgi:hypothetical protein